MRLPISCGEEGTPRGDVLKSRPVDRKAKVGGDAEPVSPSDRASGYLKAICRALSILILGGTGCISTAPDQTRTGDVSSQPLVAGEQKGALDLPGIGEAPGGSPSSQPIVVSDPLEPVNRVFFYFNDKLYFWVLKPVSKGYGKVVPQPVRLGVKNFFSNIATPVRLVNCVLQTEFKDAWIEIERFAINTTVGVAGFGDPALNRWHMESSDADLGQTLGHYGVGPSIYIDWPIIGPSNVRDTVGYAGDLFLDPLNYLVPGLECDVGVMTYETVNDTSLKSGDYDDLKKAAIDPYIALRDAYYQNRRSLIEDSEEHPAGASR